MSVSGRIGARFGLALLGAGLFLASGAAAQQAGTSPGRAASDAVGDALSRNLRLLAENPTSLIALMGAGRASLEGGDAQAALTFFARAEEVAPKDGRIKMWIGSALVQLEQPRPALRFFDEAKALGVPESDLAGDRGLVYDMLGDPRRAQQDYQLALRHGRDPEVTRRLALSLAISGERERALQLLEEQLLLRDPAAARTRALVLALTGDSEGADRAAQAAMSGAQAQAMAPFLARLPSLSLADRALAVHFGHFPGSGQPEPTSYAALAPITDAGTPDSSRPALGTRGDAGSSPDGPRRRPDAGTGSHPARGGATTTNRSPTTQTAAVAPGGAVSRPPVSSSALNASSRRAAEGGRPVPTLAARDAEPAPPPTTRPAESGDRLAEVAAALANLSDEQADRQSGEPPRPVVTGGRGTARATVPATTARSGRAAATPKKATPPPPREPSRVWVQIAGGANAATLPREYARLKAKAPKLLGSRPGWTVPVNATNRLLVGPFASGREAQAFVNELGKQGVSGFAWTSIAGQKIERLPAR
jgi:Flp pilus assembly protein TadD